MLLSELNIFQSIALDKVLKGLQALNDLSLYGMEYEEEVDSENKYELAKLRYAMVGRKLSYVLIKLLYDTGLLKRTMPEDTLKVSFDLPNPEKMEGIVLTEHGDYAIPEAEGVIDTLLEQFHGYISSTSCFLFTDEDTEELQYDLEIFLDEEDVKVELENIIGRYGDTFLYVYMIQLGDLEITPKEAIKIGQYICPTPFGETTYYHKERTILIYAVDLSEMAGGYEYSIDSLDPYGFVCLLKKSIVDPPRLCVHGD